MSIHRSLNVILGITFGLGVLTLSDKPLSNRGFVSQAEAVIGRPLTPFSVAGVARRTTRRAIYQSYSYGYGSYPNYAYSYYSYGYPYYGYGNGYSYYGYSSSYPYYGYSNGYPYYGYSSGYPYYRTAYAWGWRR